MIDNSQDELDALLKSLRSKDANFVADEITRVIARGMTEEIEIKGKVKELSQRPLNSDEAYKIALEMLVASLEPLIMREHALREFEDLMDMNSSIVWLQDFVEKSPVSFDSYEDVSIPSLNGLEGLENSLKNLIKLIGQV